MWSNIGGKIKALAKVVCWIGILLSVALGVMMILGGTNMGRMNINGLYVDGTMSIIAGVVTIVLGSLFSWCGSFVLYGFGQLVENSERI